MVSGVNPVPTLTHMKDSFEYIIFNTTPMFLFPHADHYTNCNSLIMVVASKLHFGIL